MLKLNNIKNSHSERKPRKRVGRGIGSGTGKTAGRGVKGAGARSGHTHRLGYEGGQFRLFMKLPIRGFSNARFKKPMHVINLDVIDHIYSDGEIVNEQTLRDHGYINGPSYGVKVLGTGELTKKVTVEVDAISTGARDKLQKAKIPFTLKEKNKRDEESGT